LCINWSRAADKQEPLSDVSRVAWSIVLASRPADLLEHFGRLALGMQGLALLTAERLLPERRLDLVLLRIKASSGFSDGGRDPRALRGRLEFGYRLMARPQADDQSAGLARAPRQSDTRQV